MQELYSFLTAQPYFQLMLNLPPLSPPPGGVPSLIAGLSVGLLAGYGAYRVSNDKREVKVSLCKWNVIPQLQRIHLEDAPFMNALYQAY